MVFNIMSEIWAVILAAGESKRMGSPKMLLPFNGSTMIECVISNVTKSDVDRIIVVLGAEKEALIPLMGKWQIEYCYNENYKEGMLSSVQCGFKNLSSGCKASLVFQGDQPLITSNTINTVINAYLSSEKGIVIPVYKNKRGHPILIDMKYRNDIDKLSPDKGLRSLTYKFPSDVLEVDTDESGILRDFDTYDQYTIGINLIK
jgi:molybdenum cofactor cytidylyltransferase